MKITATRTDGQDGHAQQAAAKAIAVLQDRGYVAREADPATPAAKRLLVTRQGFEMLGVAEQIFDDLQDRWAEQIGADQLAQLEVRLTALVGGNSVRGGHARLDHRARSGNTVDAPEGRS